MVPHKFLRIRDFTYLKAGPGLKSKMRARFRTLIAHGMWMRDVGCEMRDAGCRIK